MIPNRGNDQPKEPNNQTLHKLFTCRQGDVTRPSTANSRNSVGANISTISRVMGTIAIRKIIPMIPPSPMPPPQPRWPVPPYPVERQRISVQRRGGVGRRSWCIQEDSGHGPTRGGYSHNTSHQNNRIAGFHIHRKRNQYSQRGGSPSPGSTPKTRPINVPRKR